MKEGDSVVVTFDNHEDFVVKDRLGKYTVNGYIAASVKSRTFENGTHAVILNTEGVVVHDPNPNQKFLGGECDRYKRVSTLESYREKGGCMNRIDTSLPQAEKELNTLIETGEFAIKIPKGCTLLTKDTFIAPDNFVGCWANPNRTRWWQFWIPIYRYSYLAKKEAV